MEPLKRIELMDKLQEIQDKNDNMFRGNNESQLHTREEIADLFEAEQKKQFSKDFELMEFAKKIYKPGRLIEAISLVGIIKGLSLKEARQFCINAGWVAES